MPTREVIIPKGMEILYEKFHYCPGIKVGNTLYISGQVGRDENLQVVEGIEAQFVQAFENGRVERGIATPNSHAKPDMKVSRHPAPRLFGACHAYLFSL